MNIELMDNTRKKLLKAGALLYLAFNLTGCTAPKPVDSNAKLANPVPTTEQITTAPKISAEIRPEQMPQIKTPEARIVAQKLNEKLVQNTPNGRNEAVVENDLESQELRTLLNINPKTDKIILFTSTHGDNRIIILRADSTGKLTINLGQQNQILIPSDRLGLSSALGVSSLGNTDSTSAIANDPKLLSLTYDILTRQPNGVIPISVNEIYVPGQAEAHINPAFVTKLSTFGIKVVDNNGAVLSPTDGRVRLPEQSTSKEVTLTYNLNTLNPKTDIVLNLKYIGKKILLTKWYKDRLFLDGNGEPSIDKNRTEKTQVSLVLSSVETLKEAKSKEIPEVVIESKENLQDYIKNLRIQ